MLVHPAKAIVLLTVFANVSLAFMLDERVLPNDVADLKGKCKSWMYKQSDFQMSHSLLPHVSALRTSLFQKFAGEAKERCSAHNNTRVGNFNDSLPLISPKYVQGCCVQSCRIGSLDDLLVGYLVSGTKLVNEKGIGAGKWMEDDRCKDEWGMAKIHIIGGDKWGRICKQNESQSIRLGSVPDNDEEEMEWEEKRLAIDLLPSCDDISFPTASGVERKAPSWVRLNGTRPKEDVNGGEQPSESSPSPSGDDKSTGVPTWVWLGPLLGAIVTGMFSVIAVRCSKSVIIRTAQRGDQNVIEEVEINEGHML